MTLLRTIRRAGIGAVASAPLAAPPAAHASTAMRYPTGASGAGRLVARAVNRCVTWAAQLRRLPRCIRGEIGPHHGIVGVLVVLGCSSAPAVADVVSAWNENAVAAAVAGGRPAPVGNLDVTMVHIAMHDAIQAFQRRFETYEQPIAHPAGSPVVAAATAARTVLVNRFPAQATTIAATYQTYLASNGLSTADAGVTVGEQAALNIINRRAGDGSHPPNPEVFVGGLAVGQWRPTPLVQSMSAPWLGDVVPFALNDSAGLLPEPPPPALQSGAYAKAYNEVKELGARWNSKRTDEETDLALFYSGSFLVQLNRALREVASAHLSDIGDSARLFALANIAASDGLISCWKTKRSTFFWRPSTAIQNGHHDGNDQTEGDASWVPLVNDPPYPDYTSGANTFASAFMRTLELFFGNDAYSSFSLTSNAPGVVNRTRTYFRFSDVAADVVEARILLGIHFRFADTVARRQGNQAAEWVFAHQMRPIE